MKNFSLVLSVLGLSLTGCSKSGSYSNYLLVDDPDNAHETVGLGLDRVARIFAALPIETAHMNEVYDAVTNSSGNGYDEEYTMKNLLTSPGTGVGEEPTKSGKTYIKPLKTLLSEYVNSSTKADPTIDESFLKTLEESDLQIYWPYSEDWDKECLPVITFDPGNNSGYNKGYRLSRTSRGDLVVDTVRVDENLAMKQPVWVINNNNDADKTPAAIFTPNDIMKNTNYDSYEPSYENMKSKTSTKSNNRILRMKSFTMLRHYDSWFKGGSEFYIKCGSVNGFSASTEAELKLYNPSVTDYFVVVPRKYLNVRKDYDCIILTNFTNQMENLAFLIVEDDGGTQTSWRCSATVKIKSKSYGFEVDIPYKENDDIVWRGQLSATFFQSADYVRGRFGDVEIEFELE